MANFLKVNKDLFSLGLNPTEILVYAQVAEFNRNTGDCFISDKAMAENFGVSDKTISRALATLEEKGLIRRETKNIKGGKERHIFTTDKLSLEDATTDKLSFDNGQNDLIKDKGGKNKNGGTPRTPFVFYKTSQARFYRKLNAPRQQ